MGRSYDDGINVRSNVVIGVEMVVVIVAVIFVVIVEVIKILPVSRLRTGSKSLLLLRLASSSSDTDHPDQEHQQYNKQYCTSNT